MSRVIRIWDLMVSRASTPYRIWPAHHPRESENTGHRSPPESKIGVKPLRAARCAPPTPPPIACFEEVVTLQLQRPHLEDRATLRWPRPVPWAWPSWETF